MADSPLITPETPATTAEPLRARGEISGMLPAHLQRNGAGFRNATAQAGPARPAGRNTTERLHLSGAQLRLTTEKVRLREDSLRLTTESLADATETRRSSGEKLR